MITLQVEKKLEYYNLVNSELIKNILIVSNKVIDMLVKESCLDW
jgi:hypothetical protein